MKKAYFAGIFLKKSYRYYFYKLFIDLVVNAIDNLSPLFQFFAQNGKNEDQFEVEPPEFDIEDVGAQVR